MLTKIITIVGGALANKVKDMAEKKTSEYVANSVLSYVAWKGMEKTYDDYFGSSSDNKCTCPYNSLPKCTYFESGELRTVECIPAPIDLFS